MSAVGNRRAAQGIFSAALIFVLLTSLLFAGPAAVAAGSATSMSPRDIYARTAPSVVGLLIVGSGEKTTRGTGFFVQPKVIATNAHLVRDMVSGRVVLQDGSVALMGQVLLSDPMADLALVTVQGAVGHPLEVPASEAPAIGDRVFVIGNPKGLAGTLSDGLVSAVRGTGRGSMLQLSAPISPGSSGSPVLNEKGRVIGVIRGRLPDGANLSFAAPASSLIALQKAAPDAVGAFSAPPLAATPAVPGLQMSSHHDQAQMAEIVLGVPLWDTVEATAHILKALIERRFPVHVRLARSTTEEAFREMSERQGTIDVLPEVWLPSYQVLWQKHAGGEIGVVANQKPYVGFQQLCVPGFVEDRYGVRKISDLGRPEVAKLFDSDGDGKGEIWIGQEDWYATQIQILQARDVGYGPLYELLTGPEEEAWKRLERFVAKKQPVLTYCYSPHWTTETMDLHALAMPPYQPACFSFPPPLNRPGEKPKASCSAPVPYIHIAFSTRLFRKAPAVARMLSTLELSAEMVGEWSVAMHRKGAEPRSYSRHWVASNADRLTRR